MKLVVLMCQLELSLALLTLVFVPSSTICVRFDWQMLCEQFTVSPSWMNS